MKTRTRFPRRVREIGPVRIALSDGVRLAARIWLPEDAEQNPVPAILEYLPYRWQDGTAPRDALTHPWFAGQGYACVRVDMRGSGNSEGALRGEYLQQEQDDALEVIDWIARQNWCSGNVGMIGISWGGFNGLQVAARRPPALKAIVSVCSTDDRYADDIHYMGGAMLCDNIAWSTYMFSLNTTPPDPQFLGDGWKDVWRQRLSGSGLWLEDWLEHQRRTEFYKHGSICENPDAIQCPVYAVGGWVDGYTNAVFRLLSTLKSPCKALVGPWAHQYPHFAVPGPAIGFLQECLRWWDKWLKGIENGIMDEPLLRCWMQYPDPPKTIRDSRPGRWIAETEWPPATVTATALHMNSGGLSAERCQAGTVTVSSPETIGQAAGHWCPYGADPDQPGDQRMERGGSLWLETEPLETAVEVLGAPVVHLCAACSRRAGFVAVCLNEVFPCGASERVSYGVLNLTHRDSHENPEPLAPGRTYAFRIDLNAVAHRFGAGNRIAVAASTAYWPVVWPAPEKTSLEIHLGASRLELPVRSGGSETAGESPFDAPEGAAPLNAAVLRQGHNRFWTERDIGSGAVRRTNSCDEGITRFDDFDGWTVESTHIEEYSIHPDDPNSARCEIVWTERFSRRDWAVSSRTRTMVTSSPTHFEVEAGLEAAIGDEPFHAQSWRRSIARRLV